MGKYIQKSSARSSTRSPFRNVSQEQYDLVNNTNQTNESVIGEKAAKLEEMRAEGAENLLSVVTRGMAITPDGFNSNTKHKKQNASSNKKAKQAGKSSHKKNKSVE